MGRNKSRIENVTLRQHVDGVYLSIPLLIVYLSGRHFSRNWVSRNAGGVCFSKTHGSTFVATLYSDIIVRWRRLSFSPEWPFFIRLPKIPPNCALINNGNNGLAGKRDALILFRFCPLHKFLRQSTSFSSIRVVIEHWLTFFLSLQYHFTEEPSSFTRMSFDVSVEIGELRNCYINCF